jgi:carbamoyltransferase
MDLASSVQKVTEEILMRIVSHVHAETGLDRLCLAGGVALNCVANGRILREGPFEDIWIQPAAGDAGGALGAALLGWHRILGKPRELQTPDGAGGSFLGPSFDRETVRKELDALGAKVRFIDDEDALLCETASLLASGKVVGFVSGRMEFGPRALGARSILGDARDPGLQSALNRKIKFRESFRPFAPSVLEDRAGEYFEIDRPSPYMLLVAPVKRERLKPLSEDDKLRRGLDRMKAVRSDVPAVTHVDGSARIQTVNPDQAPRFHRLLKAFEERTGCGLLVNTSFNIRGEPIVCSPSDAYRCFMFTDMDALVVENALCLKEDQPPLEGEAEHRKRFRSD